KGEQYPLTILSFEQTACSQVAWEKLGFFKKYLMVNPFLNLISTVSVYPSLLHSLTKCTVFPVEGNCIYHMCPIVHFLYYLAHRRKPARIHTT
ncbi:hypothetical protein ANANG_G00228980, partial [Anguilla anguilla]